MQAGRQEDGPNEEKEFYDPETAKSFGMSHVSSQPSSIASPRGMTSRDSCLPHYSRNSMGTSGNVFFFFLKIHLLKKGYLRRHPVTQTIWHPLVAQVCLELP